MVEGLLVHLAEVLSAVPVVSVWPCSLGSTLAKKHVGKEDTSQNCEQFEPRVCTVAGGVQYYWPGAPSFQQTDQTAPLSLTSGERVQLQVTG